jgi:hypothetical protein
VKATVVIDGRTELDGTFDQWQEKPPELLTRLIKPNAPRQPYMMATAMALAEAHKLNRAIHIEIHTHTKGWTLTVEHQ